jgi:16S rRNA (adenine1518-N6/adenine1519-N6)-dimethyltransferase
LTRAAFSKRRKTLRNGFKMGGLGLQDAALDAAFHRAQIDPARRPETLGMEEFAAMANALAPQQE